LKVIKDPRLPLKYFLLSLSPSILSIIIVYSYWENFFTSSFLVFCLGFTPFITIALAIPAFMVAKKIFTFQTDVIKFLISEKKGWQYSPEKNRKRWKKIKATSKFPQIFRKGNSNQVLSDEIFGAFPGKNPVDFWQGIFTYEKKNKNINENRPIHCYRKDILAIRLSKKIRVSFALIHESVFHKFFNFFRSKEINVESVEFNRSFAVYYDGKRMKKENDIFSILSPTVQLHLVEMKRRMGEFSIYFIKDVCFFVFPNKFFPKMKTNFLWEARLHPADQINFNNKISSLLEICGEIVPFLKK